MQEGSTDSGATQSLGVESSRSQGHSAPSGGSNSKAGLRKRVWSTHEAEGQGLCPEGAMCVAGGWGGFRGTEPPTVPARVDLTRVSGCVVELGMQP